MNSWRLSSVMWPVRVRKSMPANHSSSVSCDLGRERVQVADEALRDRLEALGAGALEGRQDGVRQILVGQVAGTQGASSIVAGPGPGRSYSGTAAAPGEHALPEDRERGQLVLGEVPQEALADAVEVRRPRGRQHLGALVGQHRVAPAAVVGAVVALDQPVVDEPVDEPRHPGAGEQHGVGQLGHPALAVGRRLERDQDLVRAERQIVRGGELGVERFHQCGVDAQQPAPRAEFRRPTDLRWFPALPCLRILAGGSCATQHVCRPARLDTRSIGGPLESGHSIAALLILEIWRGR